MLLMVSVHNNVHPYRLLLAAILQLFSSEEKHVSQQHSVTVYGAPGPEPFTIFSVTAQTTAKQLLDMVSAPARVKLFRVPQRFAHSKPASVLQVVAAAGSPADYFLCEEKVPLLKERSEVKRCAQHRPLAPEEEVVRLVWGWTTEEGYVGRICLKLRDEVRFLYVVLYIYILLSIWLSQQ